MRRLIDRAAADLGRLGATPQVAHVAEVARATDAAERLDAVAALANVDHLAAAGVELPPGLRVVPRTFEDPDETLLEPLVSYRDGRGSVYCNGRIVTVEEKA